MSTFLALLAGMAIGYYILTEVSASVRRTKQRIRKTMRKTPVRRTPAQKAPQQQIIIIRVP
jgi:hypothetical protein